MTTGGYPPPPDSQGTGGYQSGYPSFGGQPADYTQQFQNPIHSGYTPDQGGQFGAPGAGDQHDSRPYYGGTQFGVPRYGAPDLPPAGTSGAPGELLPRLGARIIDSLIVGIPMAILTFIMVFGSNGSGFTVFVMSLLSGAAAFGYSTYLESSQGATIGKKLLGLSVVAPQGGHPTLEQAAKRNAFVALQILTGVPFLGWLASLASFVAWVGAAATIEQDAMKQGFHDKFAGGTRVVKS